MCGRTACTLCPDSIVKACQYKVDNKIKEPEWMKLSDHEYYPSYNHSPDQYLPVMIMKSHIEDNCDPNQRLISPMKWGLIPSWHQGDVKNFQYKLNNCRVEGMEEKRSFKSALNRGRRCVILCEGYFEWQTIKTSSKPTKQPYFFYFPQDHVSFKERSWQDNESELVGENGEWKGPRLLTMAGLFEKRDDGLYSFTVITVAAHDQIKWIHDRMPAILNGDEEVRKWLDYGSVTLKEALVMLRPTSHLELHAVSTAVGNSRNNSIDNVLPYVKKEEEQKASNVKKESAKTSLVSGQQSLDKWFGSKLPKKAKKEEPVKGNNNNE